MKINRWSSLQFKNGKIAKNRVVVPPMASKSASDDGEVTEELVENYRQRAQSGAGIIFVEYSYVHLSGKGGEFQLGITCESDISGLKSLASVIQKSGALAGIQIVHTGGKSNSKLIKGFLLGPSVRSVPTTGDPFEKMRAISETEIEEMIEWYVSAAGRAERAGFDIVELHAAHGYGLNQWLSPITNVRKDKYGGVIENRARMILEISRRIKQRFPTLLLAIRMPLHDHLEDGLTKEEMFWVVEELEKIGLDLIDVSSGLGGWQRPRDKNGEGYLVEDAAIYKKHFDIPVIGVGGIKSGKYIDEILKEEGVDFTAVGRAILEGPQAWYSDHLATH